MRYLTLALALASASAPGDKWTPPENPDPQAILQEAQGDTAASRYEAALAKHVWFHENALSIEPAFYGVRLSFALSYWHELAQKYPPALTKLQEIRDEAAREVLEGKDVRESFHDMAAINDTLEEDSLTKDTFQALDGKNPKAAKQVFDIAQPALVRAKAYSLCGKYVEPKGDYAAMRENYRRGKQLAKDPRFGPRHLDFANKNFANDATTLVAILAVNDRKTEAEEIARSAGDEWDDASFHDELAKAVKGEVPDPWP